jgi:hypothetical protein
MRLYVSPVFHNRLIGKILTQRNNDVILQHIKEASHFLQDKQIFFGDCPDFRWHHAEAMVVENGTVPFAARKKTDCFDAKALN